MTTRKPPGVSWQTWVDRQIEAARADGSFEDLPGYGKPIESLGRPRDDLWWVREKLRRENVEYLPPALVIAKARETALDEAMSAPTEAKAREIIDAVNAEIRYANSHVIEGPPSTSVVIDVEEILARWREIERPMAPVEQTRPMSDRRLIFVYNVDASPVALLKDLYSGITTGTTDCQLCDLTFGRLLKDRGWNRFVRSLPIEVEFQLRSTFRRRFPTAADGAFPAAFVDDGAGGLHEVISADQMNEAEDLTALRELVAQTVERIER